MCQIYILECKVQSSQIEMVSCAVGVTEKFKVEVGLHQRSALNPFLFGGDGQAVRQVSHCDLQGEQEAGGGTARQVEVCLFVNERGRVYLGNYVKRKQQVLTRKSCNRKKQEKI